MEGGAPLLTMRLSRPKAATTRCALRDDTCTQGERASDLGGCGLAEIGLPLEELVRRGAREILQRAVEAEVALFLEGFESVSLLDGRRAVVRNGHLPVTDHPNGATRDRVNGAAGKRL